MLPRPPPPPQQRLPVGCAGYALFDVLVALLLLATTLLGAGAALLQSIASSRAAALQTTAVDLAADLTESLQTSADPADRQSVLAAWRGRVGNLLPDGAAATDVEPEDTLPSDGTALVEVFLRWRDHANGQPFSLRLPVILASESSAP